MPSLTITTGEGSGSGTGVPTGTGTAFVAGAFDAGPPAGPLYVRCQSLTDVIAAFGARSATSSLALDWLAGFFGETPGAVAYVTRATDNTATTATLTLQDGLGSPKPTVLVTATSPGAQGSSTFITVTRGTGATFTADTASSTTLANISSFAGIGAGTFISGAGIPTGTHVVSVTPGAGTAVISNAATATASGVTITPVTFTVIVTVEDSSGNIVAQETHGPYYVNSQLLADTSTWVTFAQSTGSGNTTNQPGALAITALSGGADPSDLTDASHVSALANFPASLGPGTVSLPGKTSATAHQGIRDHVNAANRWGVLDMVDAASSSSVLSQASLGSGDWSRCFLIQGSGRIPGVLPDAPRTVAGSSVVAALRAKVARTSNQAAVPAGRDWPLSYFTGFTQYFGPLPASSQPAGSFSDADVQAMSAAGVNVFANFYGALCLYGFVSPVSSEADAIYDQANAATERMALVADCQAVMANYLFDLIDPANIAHLTTEINGVCLSHYGAGALYDGGTGLASQAFLVATGPPINTPQTALAKQLNVEITTRFPRYADNVDAGITVIPVTVSIPS